MIPKIEKTKPKIVTKDSVGTIKILERGLSGEILPKLYISMGKVKTWADNVAASVYLSWKTLGIFLKRLKNQGCR